MNETSSASGAGKPGKKRWWLALVLLVPVGAAGYFGWKTWYVAHAKDYAKHSEWRLDLLQPDALIESESLAALPRELLEVPVLRDVLTEDFVFYYEHNADRLGLSGSLRRIVYEHDLAIQDNLINMLLDEPATVALWRGNKGKLAHVAVLLHRNGLATLLSSLARVALDDTQLAVAAVLEVGGEDVTVYRLRYAPDKTLLFASVEDQLLVLSDVGMLLEGGYASARQARDATESLEAILDGDAAWREAFGMEEPRSRHRLTLGADFLAMGYRAFFPALAGFSLEKSAKGWQTRVAYDPVDDEKSLDYAPLWRGMPMGASACVALPVSVDMPRKVLKRLGATPEQIKPVSEQLQGPVGLCWYPDSRLYTPLVVTRITGDAPAAIETTIEPLFGKMIGSIEANYSDDRFPVETLASADGKRWQRTVGSNFGQYAAAQLMDPAQLASSGFFNVTLARKGDMLMFSLDDKLVEQAMATLDKRYPPLADTLPADRSVPLYVAPEKLAPLLQQEAMASLPARLEPVFRNAAETHLLPKLDALSRYGQVAVMLPPDTVPDEQWQWLPLEWKSL